MALLGSEESREALRNARVSDHPSDLVLCLGEGGGSGLARIVLEY